MLATYDLDPVASLTEALRLLTGHVDLPWDALVGSLAVPYEMKARLSAGDVRAMDDLVKRLVEFRSLEE